MRRIDPRILAAFRDGVATFDDAFFEYVVGCTGALAGRRIVRALMRDRTHLGTAHRAQVLDVLVKLLPGVGNLRVVFGKRLVSVEGACLGFADGSEAEADLVVGCDGIRSVCRKLVFASDDVIATPQFAGMVVYRGFIKMPVAEAVFGTESAHNRIIYLGHGGHIIVFPMAQGTLVNISAFHSRDTWDSDQLVQQAQEENARRDFDGSRWTDKVTKIIEVSGASSPAR